jgi:hypothetical protein
MPNKKNNQILLEPFLVVFLSDPEDSSLSLRLLPPVWRLLLAGAPGKSVLFLSPVFSFLPFPLL